MRKCINKECKSCKICDRFDPNAGFHEGVLYPNGSPDCTLIIIKEVANANDLLKV